MCTEQIIRAVYGWCISNNITIIYGFVIWLEKSAHFMSDIQIIFNIGIEQRSVHGPLVIPRNPLRVQNIFYNIYLPWVWESLYYIKLLFRYSVFRSVYKKVEYQGMNVRTFGQRPSFELLLQFCFQLMPLLLSCSLPANPKFRRSCNRPRLCSTFEIERSRFERLCKKKDYCELTLTHDVITEGAPLWRTCILPSAQLCYRNIGSWLQLVNLLTCLNKFVREFQSSRCHHLLYVALG